MAPLPPKPDPGELKRLQDLNLRLRQEWRVNRVFIESMARHGGFHMGVPTVKEAARGHRAGPGVMSRMMERHILTSEPRLSSIVAEINGTRIGRITHGTAPGTCLSGPRFGS
jgi:hypothetical protein